MLKSRDYLPRLLPSFEGPLDSFMWAGLSRTSAVKACSYLPVHESTRIATVEGSQTRFRVFTVVTNGQVLEGVIHSTFQRADVKMVSAYSDVNGNRYMTDRLAKWLARLACIWNTSRQNNIKLAARGI